MRKPVILAFLAVLFGTALMHGQARKELNFGLIGANFEIPVHEDVTIAPGVSTNFDVSWVNLGVRGNYYFDKLFKITDPQWDVYAGANAGYSIYAGGNDEHDSKFDVGLQTGGRWFFSDQWGLYVELSGGITGGMGGSLGFTVKL